MTAPKHPPKPAKPLDPDWERIRALYETDAYTPRELAAWSKAEQDAGRSGYVSHVTITAHANKEQWTKNLARKIDQRAEQILNAQAVKALTPSVNKKGSALTPTEAQVVEVNAQVVATIRAKHRGTVARAQALALRMLAELETQTGGLPELDQLRTLVVDASSNPKELMKHLAAFDAVISLPERAKTMKALAEVLQRCIALEREAYGIGPVKAGVDDDQPPPPSTASPSEHYRWLAQVKPKIPQ